MRAEKEFAVKEVQDRLKEAESVVLTGYAGLSAEQMNLLRGALEERSANYMVVSNRLFKIAVKELELNAITEFLNGPVGVVFGPESYSDVLKDLMKFRRENDALKILGGYIEKQVIGPEAVKIVASLPSKAQLQARLLGALEGPITGFVGVLQQRLGSLVRVLDAIAKKRAESGE